VCTFTIIPKIQAAGGEVAAAPKGFAGLTARYDNFKPVIAAVNGVAMGGGFEIALACDLIIASGNAVFALPEPTVGTAALAGGMQRLPQQIPLKHAMGMLLTGRRVSAREGRELGFVNEVVPPDELMSAARRWAEEIAMCAPLSVRATKQCAMDSLEGGSIAENMSRRCDQRTAMLKSEDYAEGPRAFAEKRLSPSPGISICEALENSAMVRSSIGQFSSGSWANEFAPICTEIPA